MLLYIRVLRIHAMTHSPLGPGPRLIQTNNATHDQHVITAPFATFSELKSSIATVSRDGLVVAVDNIVYRWCTSSGRWNVALCEKTVRSIRTEGYDVLITCDGGEKTWKGVDE